MSGIFQDVFVGHGGAERCVAPVSDFAPDADLTIGVRARDVHGPASLAHALMEYDAGVVPPYADLLSSALRVLDRREWIGPLLSFHHHFGLLAVSRGPATYYIHSPTRVLHEPHRVPWESQGIDPAILEELRAREETTVLRAANLVTNSRATADRILHGYGREPRVVHPPVGLMRSSSIAPSVHLTRGREYILTVSRLSASKGFEECGPVVRDFGLPWVIVGTGPSQPRLDGDVTFAGALSDSATRWLVEHATICLSPGLEDFGLFAAESLILGKSTVIRAGSGVLEIAPTGRAHAYGAPSADNGISLLAALEGAHRGSRGPTIELDESLQAMLEPARFGRAMAKIARL